MVDETLLDVLEGRRSRSSDLPVIVSSLDHPRGGFLVLDGHHRVVEALMRDTSFGVSLGNGSRTITAMVDPRAPRIERTGGAYSWAKNNVNIAEHVYREVSRETVSHHTHRDPRSRRARRDVATAKTMIDLWGDFLHTKRRRSRITRSGWSIDYRTGSEPQREVLFTQENLEAGHVLADAIEEHPWMTRHMRPDTSFGVSLNNYLRYFLHAIEGGLMSSPARGEPASWYYKNWDDFSSFIDLLTNALGDLYREEHQRRIKEQK